MIHIFEEMLGWVVVVDGMTRRLVTTTTILQQLWRVVTKLSSPQAFAMIGATQFRTSVTGSAEDDISYVYT